MIGMEPVVDLAGRNIKIPHDDVGLARGLQHDKGFLEGLVDRSGVLGHVQKHKM
jgi:hypothetical protein